VVGIGAYIALLALTAVYCAFKVRDDVVAKEPGCAAVGVVAMLGPVAAVVWFIYILGL
jgi:hypothetical protein